MTNAQKRRWWVLHPLTILSGLLVAAATFALNVVRDVKADVLRGTVYDLEHVRHSFGWPITFMRREYSQNMLAFDAASVAIFHVEWFAFDVILSLLLCLMSAFTIERWLRRGVVPFRMRFRTLLALAAAFATACFFLDWTWISTADSVRENWFYLELWHWSRFIACLATCTCWFGAFDIADAAIRRISRRDGSARS